MALAYAGGYNAARRDRPGLGGWNPLPWVSLATWVGWVHDLTGWAWLVHPLAVGLFSIAIFLVKVLAPIFVFIWVHWTVPRFRYDQFMDLGWKWLLPIALIATIAFAFLGFTAHPERSALFRSLALGLLLLALLAAILGYLVPRIVVPALTDSVVNWNVPRPSWPPPWPRPAACYSSVPPLHCSPAPA